MSTDERFTLSRSIRAVLNRVAALSMPTVANRSMINLFRLEK